MPSVRNYSPSPPRSQPSSSGSATSLRALELSEGTRRPPHSPHGRRASILGTPATAIFDFQRELLPLSLSEPLNEGEPLVERNIGFVKGNRISSCHRQAFHYLLITYKCLLGIAIVVGNQIGSGIL